MASVKDLTRFGVDLSDVRLIAHEEFEKLVKQGCKPEIGDVLISKDGNSALDTVCNVKEPLDVVLLSSVAILRPNKNVVDSDFLKYYFSSSITIEYLKNNFISGAAIPRVVLKDFKKAKIKLPPLCMQKKISSILNSFDDRIENLINTNVILEAIAQTLFKSWFIDFDPVHAKAEGRMPEGIDAETANLFPAKFVDEQSRIPMGWMVASLGDWLSALETGRRPKGGVSEIKSGLPSIGAESIVKIGQFNYSKTKFVSRDFFAKLKSGVLQSHDVLLYKDGGKPGVFLPRVSMFGEEFPFKECAINEHVFRIRIKEPFNQPYLYFWLWCDATMHELKHRGGKAAIPGINQSDVKELKILMPSKAILARFNDIVSPLISKILINSKQIHASDEIRNALLPRLISGQLKLPSEAMSKEFIA